MGVVYRRVFITSQNYFCAHFYLLLLSVEYEFIQRCTCVPVYLYFCLYVYLTSDYGWMKYEASTGNIFIPVTLYGTYWLLPLMRIDSCLLLVDDCWLLMLPLLLTLQTFIDSRHSCQSLLSCFLTARRKKEWVVENREDESGVEIEY